MIRLSAASTSRPAAANAAAKIAGPCASTSSPFVRAAPYASMIAYATYSAENFWRRSASPSIAYRSQHPTLSPPVS